MDPLDARFALSTAVRATETLMAAGSKPVIPGPPDDGIDPAGVVPPDIARFLARLRLLEGVPFNYLVPDAALLPMEAIRFFYVDRNWLDAVVEGALSVGTVNSADREKLANVYPTVRAEVDTAERLVRMNSADAAAVDAAGRPIGVAGPMTGFLMRSRIVSGWPAMHVRAYAFDRGPDADDDTIPDDDVSPDRVRVLRMERLAPAVLLVLFDGVPAVVHIEEPRSGIQFGVRLQAVTADSSRAKLPLRDVTDPNRKLPDPPIDVPFRKRAPGVINVKQLATALAGKPVTNIGAGFANVDAAEFAIELLRFPIRQVFGDTTLVGGGDHPDDFRATIHMTAARDRFALAERVLGL